MSVWYALWDALPFEMLHWDFMKNALLALLLMAPLFGILSTMIVTGRMSFFSDALGHSAFTGIAIGIICGMAAPIWAAVAFSVVLALLFSFVRSRSNQAADTLIGVFSSSAVALGIFVATLGGGRVQRGACSAVFLCPQPLQSGGGYPDRRVFQLCRGAWHFRCNLRRRQLYPVQ